ncbi:hypothetical protein TcBrA4_0139510 [Trypanosoma cruzi]|nr:hypothetical protein TcBrA4_0139510 [Trypanosoma cruzi]
MCTVALSQAWWCRLLRAVVRPSRKAINHMMCGGWAEARVRGQALHAVLAGTSVVCDTVEWAWCVAEECNTGGGCGRPPSQGVLSARVRRALGEVTRGVDVRKGGDAATTGALYIIVLSGVMACGCSGLVRDVGHRWRAVGAMESL